MMSAEIQINATNKLALPLSTDQITPSWLTSALQERHPGVTVTRADLLDINRGTSTKIRVGLEYDAAGQAAQLPSRVIVKGGFDTHSPWMKDMYAWEIRFYRDVQASIALPSPRCYFAGSDPNSWQSIVIMEDLTLREVEFCHALQPQTFEQVARRLGILAQVHAQTWNSRDMLPGGRWDWMTTRFSDFSMKFNDRYLEPDQWKHYCESPRGAAVSKRFLDRGWMRHALVSLGELHSKEPYCMIHGDTHLGNLYIDKTGTPGFFDSLPARAPWHLEVAYHIGCALDIADRQKWEGALVSHYLGELERSGIERPTFDAAMSAYAKSLAYGFFIFLINETKFQTEAVNTANASRFSAAMLDHGTRDLF